MSEIEKREKEISLMLQGAKEVLKPRKFEDTARKIFDICRELTGATSGYVALLSDTGEENEVLFLEAGGMPCDVDPKLPMPIRGLREQSYNSGKAVFHNDFMNSEWVKFMPEGHVYMKNVMFAPMNIEGKTVGIIGLANKEGDFTDRDALLSEAFGDYVAAALKNHWTMEKLENSRKQYRKLYKEIENLNELLLLSNRTLRHDIKNRLMFIDMSIDMINGLSDKERENIKRSIHYCLELTNLSGSIDQGDHEKVIHLNKLLEEVLMPYPAEINMEKDVFIKGDPWVCSVVDNLLSNSVKHGKATKISVVGSCTDDICQLVIEDNGSGIPEDVKGKIFDEGFTTGDGNGMGLYIVKKRMQKYGGEIILDESSSGGTRFKLRFPRATKDEE